MEAELVNELPEGDWQYEPKWDGLSTGETMFPLRAPFFFHATPTLARAAPAGKARLHLRPRMAMPPE
jgi:hypothetical protein